MQLEKFNPRNFDESVAQGAPRRNYVPPSLIPEPVEEEPAAPPAPTFSEVELKKAEQESYRKGFLEGTKEGKMQAESEQAEVDRKLTEAVAQLAQRIAVLISEYNVFVKQQQAEMPKVALAVAKKVAGQALAENAAPLVESIAVECVKRVLGEPNITVTVNDKLSNAMEHRLVSQFASSNEPGEINIQGDATMAPGDCRIDWGAGQAERNTESLWQELEALITQMAAVPASAALPAAEAPQETPNEPPKEPPKETPKGA